MTSTLHYSLIFAAVVLFSFQTTQGGIVDTTPVLRLHNGGMSKNGHVRIVWGASKDLEVELQQADNVQFESAETIYRGRDHATFISGLKNGVYYYRIRAVGGAWSDPVTLTVNHHPLRLAFALCALGAVVFCCTAFIVFKGALHASTE